DDMESFVLIVLYHALRYLPHNKTEKTAYIINRVFNHWVRLSSGVYMGGEGRMTLFQTRAYIGRDFKLSSPPLRRWVQVAIESVKEWVDGEFAKSNPQIASHGPKMTGKERLAAIRSPLPSNEIQPIAIPARTLDNHEEMIEFFDGCLEAEDWPALADDKPHDILSDA
ncbi:hypothetical protein C0992_006776, partial [Termitomyces sp. T32_za158]